MLGRINPLEIAKKNVKITDIQHPKTLKLCTLFAHMRISITSNAKYKFITKITLLETKSHEYMYTQIVYNGLKTFKVCG